MDVLGVLFLIFLFLCTGSIISLVLLASSTLDRLRALEKDKRARADADQQANRRERVKSILGSAHERTDDIMAVFNDE